MAEVRLRGPRETISREARDHSLSRAPATLNRFSHPPDSSSQARPPHAATRLHQSTVAPRVQHAAVQWVRNIAQARRRCMHRPSTHAQRQHRCRCRRIRIAGRPSDRRSGRPPFPAPSTSFPAFSFHRKNRSSRYQSGTPTNVPIPTVLLAWHQDTGLLSSARWFGLTCCNSVASLRIARARRQRVCTLLHPCGRACRRSLHGNQAYYVCVLRCVVLRDATLCYVTRHGRRGHLPTLSHAVPVNHVLTGPGGSMSVAAASVRTPTTACSQSAQAVHPSIHQSPASVPLDALTCSFVISPLV